RERSRLGHLAGVPDVLPRAAEDPIALELEHRGIAVPAPRQRAIRDVGCHGSTLPAPPPIERARPTPRAGRAPRCCSALQAPACDLQDRPVAADVVLDADVEVLPGRVEEPTRPLG